MDGLGFTILCSTIEAWQNLYTCMAVQCCKLKIQIDVVVSSDGLRIIAPAILKKWVRLVRLKMWADCNKVTILLYRWYKKNTNQCISTGQQHIQIRLQ